MCKFEGEPTKKENLIDEFKKILHKPYSERYAEGCLNREDDIHLVYTNEAGIPVEVHTLKKGGKWKINEEVWERSTSQTVAELIWEKVQEVGKANESIEGNIYEKPKALLYVKKEMKDGVNKVVNGTILFDEIFKKQNSEEILPEFCTT